MVEQKKKSIESRLLLSVDKTDVEGRNLTVEIRVVDWIADSKHYPQLEKREFYADQATGEIKTGKAKGFNSKNFETILINAFKIGKALGMPYQIVAQCLTMAIKGTESIPEAAARAEPAQPKAEEDF